MESSNKHNHHVVSNNILTWARAWPFSFRAYECVFLLASVVCVMIVCRGECERVYASVLLLS